MTTIKDYIRDLAIDAYKLAYKDATGLEIAELSEEKQEEIDGLVDETIQTIATRIVGQD